MTRISITLAGFLLAAFAALAASASGAIEQTLEARAPLVTLASGAVIHRFFDTSPVSPSGRYVALFRFPQEKTSPRPGDVGEVVLVDRQSGKQQVVATSRGFEMQLGANVQWGATDADLFFNDVDPATWQTFAVHLDPLRGSARRMAGNVFMVSPDGSRLASYNLAKSRYAQVGYGVLLPDAQAPRNVGADSDDGIDITDVATNRVHRVITLAEIVRTSLPSIRIEHPEKFEYYLFQVKWNPQGTRLLTTIQWSPLGGGARQRAVITFKADGSDVRTAITPAQWARGGHHINWTGDGEHLSMNLAFDDVPGLEIVTVRHDGSGMKAVFSPGTGHPSFHPTDARFMVTDAYPDEPLIGQTDDQTGGQAGAVPVRLMNLATGCEQAVARVYVSKTNGEFRIDPHPAWDRSGRYVVFNGFVGATRNVHLVDLKQAMEEMALEAPCRARVNP